jgi:hypothetical protein
LTYDDNVVAIIEGEMDVAQPKDFEYIASILRQADPKFVFRHPAFLSRLLERARQYGLKTAQTIVGELFGSAISGSRSGVVGSPFPEDIELAEAARSALESCPSGSTGTKESD